MILTTGERLKDLRGKLDLEEVCRDIGISTSTLSNYENDKSIDISYCLFVYLKTTFRLLVRISRRKGNSEKPLPTKQGMQSTSVN